MGPIQHGVKRFIDDGKAESWTPIEYDYSPDDTPFLSPKLSQLSGKSITKYECKIDPKSVQRKKKKKKIHKKRKKKMQSESDSASTPVTPSFFSVSTSDTLSLTCADASSCDSLAISLAPVVDGGFNILKDEDKLIILE